MKAIISILIIIGAFWVAKQLILEYKTVEKTTQRDSGPPAPSAPADGLEGMPANFQPSLDTAEKAGADALKAWLDKYGTYLRDPKLASIQMDYAVMVARQDVREARRVVEELKGRIRPGSPVYDRLKKIESGL